MPSEEDIDEYNNNVKLWNAVQAYNAKMSELRKTHRRMQRGDKQVRAIEAAIKEYTK